jgi:fructoselysine-6-P-deglycase FrlB-like protein
LTNSGLADLLGTDTVDLDADAATALNRLTEAVQTTDAQRASQQNEQAADERVLSALGDGGLLPPSQPVTAALAILEAARITAWAGWSYLAQLPTY